MENIKIKKIKEVENVVISDPEMFERSSKEKLLELEKTGKYVFHGSFYELEQLDSRQGYNFDEKLGKMIEDGEPAVSASPYAGIAIFRAIVNNENAPKNHKSEFGYSNDKLSFGASKETLSQIDRNKKGFVYVLDRNDFIIIPGMFWRSDHAVKPIEVIEVSFDDLPENINIL